MLILIHVLLVGVFVSLFDALLQVIPLISDQLREISLIHGIVFVLDSLINFIAIDEVSLHWNNWRQLLLLFHFFAHNLSYYHLTRPC